MMNKRYTDIDALIAMLRNNIDLPFNGGDSWAHIVQIKDKLIEHIEKNAPVADVAGVVRCKDCSWFIAREEGVGNCDMIFGFTSPVSENGYCYCGERKGGDNNAAD